MSEVFFFDEGAEPRERSAVRMEQVVVQPYPDGQRVRIKVVLTPFFEKPNLVLTITNSAGQQMATADILETMLHVNELTMHLRSAEPSGDYALQVDLYYGAEPAQDTRMVEFTAGPAQ